MMFTFFDTSVTGGKVHYSLQLHHLEEVKKAFFVVSIVNKVYKKVSLINQLLKVTVRNWSFLRLH